METLFLLYLSHQCLSLRKELSSEHIFGNLSSFFASLLVYFPFLSLVSLLCLYIANHRSRRVKDTLIKNARPSSCTSKDIL